MLIIKILTQSLRIPPCRLKWSSSFVACALNFCSSSNCVLVLSNAVRLFIFFNISCSNNSMTISAPDSSSQNAPFCCVRTIKLWNITHVLDMHMIASVADVNIASPGAETQREIAERRTFVLHLCVRFLGAASISVLPLFTHFAFFLQIRANSGISHW